MVVLSASWLMMDLKVRQIVIDFIARISQNCWMANVHSVLDSVHNDMFHLKMEPNVLICASSSHCSAGKRCFGKKLMEKYKSE